MYFRGTSIRDVALEEGWYVEYVRLLRGVPRDRSVPDYRKPEPRSALRHGTRRYSSGRKACAAYPASAFALMWPSQATSEESSMFCIASLSTLTGSPEKDSVVET